jgi:hypothetical protein
VTAEASLTSTRSGKEGWDMRRQGKPKAPDIYILACHYLSRGLSKHPDWDSTWPKSDDLEDMPTLRDGHLHLPHTVDGGD